MGLLLVTWNSLLSFHLCTMASKPLLSFHSAPFPRGVGLESDT